MTLDGAIDLGRHPLQDANYRAACADEFKRTGLLVLDGFLTDAARSDLLGEAAQSRHLAYFTEQVHNVYLDEPDLLLPDTDARSHTIVSTKGAITTDQILPDSHLRTIYDAAEFRGFLCEVLGEDGLYEYADPLSSINLNYYEAGQELGWHFDNSEFAVTLLVQNPLAGGVFEFINHMRDTEGGNDNTREVAQVLAAPGQLRTHPIQQLALSAGSLVLFRGRDALHRVTQVEGDQARLLVVLAYNTEPGLSLSETARMTFFGRLN